VDVIGECMRKVYNKAVRNKVPEIIEAAGNKCLIEIMSDDELLVELEKKLSEELEEYRKSRSPEELCDIIEISMRIAELHGVSNSELEKIREKKNIERGGFSKNIFLVEVDEQ